MDSKQYEQMLSDPQLAPLLGQELLRDDLIKTILGSEIHDISYWAGKQLARNHRLTSYDNIITFFKQFGFGTLTLDKESSNQLEFTLSGNIVESRLRADPDADFQLECGIIAENCEAILNHQAEAEIDKVKKVAVKILVLTSKEEPIIGDEPIEIFNVNDSTPTE
ncbi:DUF2507 domain-containing protein [Lentilactobacillus sp. Marseille-Q4993]|uniref:DUF2507 domain-containing protein n=1 Tax=Lentilactobacillus sp. Marseille-Q4993 TaxID=3039492 RepID=UPI0024BC1A65|nr:DUF2507 domain-containing protein [Lentilactobacillus sp. Marseille-Q4993]